MDRDCIYYPVNLTPGYEAATNANKYRSDVSLNRISRYFLFHISPLQKSIFQSFTGDVQT